MKNVETTKSFYIVVVVLGLVFAGCSVKSTGDGSDSGTGSITNQLADAMNALAIASPTARASSSSSSFVLASVSSDTVKGAKEQVAEITERLGESTESECTSGITLEIRNETAVNCYGPHVTVSNDYTLASGHSFQMGDKSAPSGDLGIWAATQSDGEACAAAKMNVAVDDAANIVRSAQELMAAFLCVANVGSQTLPAVNGMLDLTSTFSVTGLTFTTAKLERLADVSSTPVYKLTLEGTVTQDSKGFQFVSENNETSTGAKGRIYGSFNGKQQGNASQDRWTGFSVIYNQTGNDLNLEYRSARNRNTTGQTFFDSNNIVDYTRQEAGEGLYYTLLSTNTQTNIGKMKFAWMAGDGDSNSRIFHAETTAGTGGAVDTGKGYFGYGPTFKSLGSSSLGDISGMICNWALTDGGMQNHSSQITAMSGKYQAQNMSRDSTGKFTPTESKIDYSIHNDCKNLSTQYTATSQADSAVKTIQANASHDLADGFIYGEVTGLTVPSYP